MIHEVEKKKAKKDFPYRLSEAEWKTRLGPSAYGVLRRAATEPSFGQPANPDAIGKTIDYKLGFIRTEVHCVNCGGHLGHIFDDGPHPAGLRYCINGLALAFRPAED